MKPCENCPVPPGKCPALTRPHPRYCELIDPGHPDYDPAFVPILVAMSGRPPRPDAAAARRMPERDNGGPPAAGVPRAMPIAGAPMPIAAEVPDVASQVRQSLAVNRCNVRQTRGCGCADRAALCYRSGLPVVVSRERCGECVRPGLAEVEAPG